MTERRLKNGDVLVEVSDDTPPQKQVRNQRDDDAVTAAANLYLQIKATQTELQAAREEAWRNPGQAGNKAVALERQLVQLAQRYQAVSASRSADAHKGEGGYSSGAYFVGSRK